jgi:hypothetical protein
MNSKDGELQVYLCSDEDVLMESQQVKEEKDLV